MKRAVLFCALAGCVLAADLLSPKDLPDGRWATPPNAAQTAARADAPKTSAAEARSSRPLAADTLTFAVPAGETLIGTLPEAIDGRPVVSYRVLRAPALSGLADRSFFWQTRPGESGPYRLLYEARFQSGPPETVAVVVNVE